MSIYEEKTLMRTGDTKGNAIIHYPITKAECVLDLKANKNYATVVVGHANSGHSKDEVDFLCDGEADQVEINSAIASLKFGGKVLVLEGTFNVNAYITIENDNITLEGMGNDTVLVGDKDISFNIIRIQKNYCKVTNFTVCSGGANGIACNGNYNLISQSIFYDNSGSGFACNGNNNTISQNTIYDNSANGISCSGSGNIILQNIIHDNSASGFSGGGNYTEILKNTIYNNTAHATVCSGSGNIISQNIVYENSGFGIVCEAKSNNNVILKNTAYNNNGHGIACNGSGNNITLNICTISIVGCGILNTGSNNNISKNECLSNYDSGIYATETSNKCTIEGNYCNENNQIGIRCFGDNSTIIANNCFDNKYAINVNSTQNNIVCFNQINGQIVNDSSTNNITENMIS